ncbi:hypothetical protein EYF80_021388 [Liparis tanakae]|uniref:Uncharacterized protein n=1 Tax=Liparis tanakae TaxID=230148 RepID=A0A4Z2HSS5_9TELE|nr:hypothetical protein EYF80_021388 [Liparis tanakae]
MGPDKVSCSKQVFDVFLPNEEDDAPVLIGQYRDLRPPSVLVCCDSEPRLANRNRAHSKMCWSEQRLYLHFCNGNMYQDPLDSLRTEHKGEAKTKLGPERGLEYDDAGIASNERQEYSTCSIVATDTCRMASAVAGLGLNVLSLELINQNLVLLQHQQGLLLELMT